jgi:alkaline phosphatase D
MKQNRPPTEGRQYFGAVTIDGATQAMTVTLHDLTGTTLHTVNLEPDGV